jgi:glutathione S-transferase
MPSDVRKLTYFPFHGRRSALLFQLAHGGCEVELQNLSFEEWGALKPKYGGLPFATMADGAELIEAMPISRMIAVENGQYPEDPLQGYECDRLMNIYYDLFNAMSGPQLAGEDKAISDCAEAKLKPFLDSIEARLGKSKWLVGDKICMVDFWVGAMYCDKFINETSPKCALFKKHLDAHPHFVRFGKDFAAENQAWLDKRDKFAL